MTEKEKIALLEEIMDVEDSLEPEMLLEDIEEWDSISALALIAKVRELYNDNLSLQKIKDFNTVKDICNYLK